MADTRIDIPVTSGLASNGEAGGGAIYNTGSLAINQLLESSIYYDNAWHILWTEPPPTPPSQS